MVDKALLSSEKMDWETPDDRFAEWNEEFRFTIDVCARADNTKCSRFFSPNDDALSMSWGHGERCWMNPPYGREIVKWMKKAHDEAFLGGNLIVCLVPARTDTGWWHDYAMRGDIRFLRGRIKFVGAKSGAPFPSALVIFDGR